MEREKKYILTLQLIPPENHINYALKTLILNTLKLKVPDPKIFRKKNYYTG